MSKEKLTPTAGVDKIDRRPATLEAYSRDLSLVQPLRPAGVVRVNSLEEVRQLVAWARQSRTPLIPVSSGPPHFRGDTVPTTGGALIVDLSGMKRIIHIDRNNRSVMFEPGVTFGELIPAVSQKGLRLNLPLLPRQSKSVVGSLLEREPVIMPKYHWDIADPLGCIEVVFGTGDYFRTGAAAGSGTIEEQWAAGGGQKEAAGPSSSSWYRLIQGAQGTMGIVTWATARCEILPRLEDPYLAGSNQLDQIRQMLHYLLYLRLANECLVLNNTNLATILSHSNQEYQKIKDALPAWILFFNLAAYDYFPEDRIKGQFEDMLKITQQVGVEAVKVLGSVNANKLLRILQQPSAEPYWKLRQQGRCQDIFFITVYDKLQDQIKAMLDCASSTGFPSSHIGIYLQPVVQGINCYCEFNLFYHPADQVETARVKELSSLATRSLMDKGAFFSRPYGENASWILNRDAETVAALKKVKFITDPDNILNPGKLCF